MKVILAAFFVSVGAILAVLALRWNVLYQAIAKTDPHPDTYAILVTGLLAAIVAIWGILSQRAIARRQVTLEYLLKTENDKDLFAAKIEFNELAKAPEGLEKYASEQEQASAQAKAIRHVLNDLELAAIGIEKGIIDFSLYSRWCRSGVIKKWNQSETFIHKLRARTGNEALMREFEAMVGWLKGSKKLKRGYFWSQWFF